MFELVGEFHRRFDLTHVSDGPPRQLTPHEFEFRDKFMQEELDEYREAVATGDMAKAADALVDLVYVALGTAHLHRFPFDDVFTEVQRANMTKVMATSAEESKRGSQLDVIKPAGWTPPDVEGILRGRGWSP